MPDPISIISASSYLIAELGKGIIGNRGDQYFCRLLDSVSNKFRSNINSPENHDIYKACRRAQLNSTIIVCSDLLKIKYNILDNFTSNSPKNLKNIITYLKEQKSNLQKNAFKFRDNLVPEDIRYLIKPGEISIESRLVEFKLQQKIAILDELSQIRGIYVEESLRTMIIQGWKIDKVNYDWYDLMTSFFLEYFKNNDRLSKTIFYNFLTESKSSDTKVLFQIEHLKENLNELSCKIDNLDKKYLESFNNVDVFLSKHNQFVTDENKKTRSEIKELIAKESSETKKLIDNLASLIMKNDNSKSEKVKQDSLIDFFYGVVDGNPLDMEIAVMSTANIVIFHNKRLKLDLRRLEYFKDTNELIAISTNNMRRWFGLPMHKEIIKFLIEVTKIQFVENYNNIDNSFSSSFIIPIKIID